MAERPVSTPQGKCRICGGIKWLNDQGVPECDNCGAKDKRT